MFEDEDASGNTEAVESLRSILIARDPVQTREFLETYRTRHGLTPEGLLDLWFRFYRKAGAPFPPSEGEERKLKEKHLISLSADNVCALVHDARSRGIASSAAASPLSTSLSPHMGSSKSVKKSASISHIVSSPRVFGNLRPSCSTMSLSTGSASSCSSGGGSNKSSSVGSISNMASGSSSSSSASSPATSPRITSPRVSQPHHQKSLSLQISVSPPHAAMPDEMTLKSPGDDLRLPVSRSLPTNEQCIKFLFFWLEHVPVDLSDKKLMKRVEPFCWSRTTLLAISCGISQVGLSPRKMFLPADESKASATSLELVSPRLESPRISEIDTGATVPTSASTSPRKLLTNSSSLLASAFTSLAVERLRRITETDLENFSSGVTSPNITSMLHLHAHIANWTSTVILQPRLTRIEQPFKKVLTIAQKLLAMNNFDCLHAVMEGLQCSAVTRLDKLWKALPQKYKLAYTQLQGIMSSQRDYVRYRSTLIKRTYPIIPYFGLILREIQLAACDINAVGRIQYRGVQLLASCFRCVARYQSHLDKYCFATGVQEICERVMACQPISSQQELYRLSLMCEQLSASSPQCDSILEEEDEGEQEVFIIKPGKKRLVTTGPTLPDGSSIPGLRMTQSQPSLLVRRRSVGDD